MIAKKGGFLLTRFFFCHCCRRKVIVTNNSEINIVYGRGRVKKINSPRGIAIVRLPEKICPLCGSFWIQPIPNHRISQEIMKGG